MSVKRGAALLAKERTWRDKQRTLKRPQIKMPTLMRLLTLLALAAGLVYGAIFALATLVEPQQAEMTIRIPATKINPQAPDNGG